MATVFHTLVTIEEAIELLDKQVGGIKPLGVEKIAVEKALGRVVAENVLAKTSHPPFDRSTVDGYAVKASDVFAATEENPVVLEVVGSAEVGVPFVGEVGEGRCVEIATGAPVPRGANAVVMVEFTKKIHGDRVLVFRPVSPGENIAETGSDVSVGDVVLRKGTVVSPREIAVLTSVGVAEIPVYRKVRAAVFSTGNEVVPCGERLQLGKVYDVNGPALTAMLAELNVEAEFMGIVPDDHVLLVEKIGGAVKAGYDLVVTSGSTSAGFGDMVYKVFKELGGRVLVHGLKLKPGKPTAVAVAGNTILFGLPGFPLSAMMVFQKLVKPVVEAMTGTLSRRTGTAVARMAFRVEAGRGKRELIPVQLIVSGEGVVAYPLLGQSGSAYVLSAADGVVEADEKREFFDEGETVEVNLLSEKIRAAELVVIGSHCPGVDLLLDLGGMVDVKVVNVGSLAGWHSVKRGEADVAGTHLFDEKNREYNVFMMDRLELRGKAVVVRGYARRIGFVTRRGNPLNIRSVEDLLGGDVVFVNRVKGSGVRTFLDVMLAERGVENPYRRIRGYDYEVRTHTAVAAAVLHGTADVGITLEAVAQHYGLEFIPLTEEIYDFVILRQRLSKHSVQKFINTLKSKTFQKKLQATLQGYRVLPNTGDVVAE